MKVINGKQILTLTIENIIDNNCHIDFPMEIYYCERLGHPTFQITISIIDEDSFIDQDGNRWIKDTGEK